MAPLPINFFDCLLALVLVAGLIRGRKHGFSQELVRLLKWVTLVVVCALLYQPLGTRVSSAGFFDTLSAFLLAYLGMALIIFLFFSVLQRRLAPKLEGSDAFGRGEYYLGMGSGLVRYACIVLACLALLNARAFTPAEVKAIDKFQFDNYGSKVFPTLHSVQVAVFEDSFTGAAIKNYLPFLLITPTEPEHGPAVPTNPSSRHAAK